MALDEYLTVAGPGTCQIVVKRSKFIANVAPAETDEEAMRFIAAISDQHKTATHNVYAYVAGEFDQWQRYSDDGEPSGTAGIPTLEVIKQLELKNTVVVVTRYFGGTLLGASGLVRAYGHAAKAGIIAAGVVKRVLHCKAKITVDYTVSGKMQNELRNFDLIMGDVSYSDRVTFSVMARPENFARLNTLVLELTSGQSKAEKVGQEYVDFPVEMS